MPGGQRPPGRYVRLRDLIPRSRRRRTLASPPNLKTLARKASSRTRRTLLTPFVRVEAHAALVRLGSDNCGWWVPEAAVRPDAIAYCAGAGEDISFDLELHRRGLHVVTIDPTPRAIAHVRAVDPGDDRFTFLPMGLWSGPGELTFFPPANAGVSHSVVNLQRTAASDGFTAKVDSLASIMATQGHDHLDLLKVDIEGAESTVLPHLLAEGPRPTVVCFEYDQPQSSRALLRLLDAFRRRGYRLVHRERWNFTLVGAPIEPSSSSSSGHATGT
jgi:FkbM family methyltransferase